MKSKSLLKSYALALYKEGKEKNQVEQFGKELVFLCNLFQKKTDLIKFLDSPMIEKKEKDKLLEETLRSSLSLSVYAFLQVLIKRKMIPYLSLIEKEYQHHFNQENGILEGRIYTPFDLKPEILNQLTEKFENKYQKKVIFRVVLDERVLAGMRIYIDDTLYDYSIDTKLNQVRNSLLMNKVK